MSGLAEPRRTEVAIVGAGASGLIAALALKQAGLDNFLLLERSTALGGVWRDNTYPGCACDIPANLYSFSDRPNPGWSSNFAGQAEILSYLEGVARRDRLDTHIRYDWPVAELRFVPATGAWRVLSQHGESISAHVVIIATGPQNRPCLPDIPGVETFQGTWCHSANWNHEIPLQGRRVAVIGTGCSAVQIVPGLAGIAGELTVFQRTPAWVLPRNERPVSAFRKRLFGGVPLLQLLDRLRIYWLMELAGLGNLGHRSVERLLTRIARSKLAREVPLAELRRALTPAYRIGCKRIAVSDDYYPAFSQPGVTLETRAIRRIAPHGIVMEDGASIEVDHIVYATGFRVADAHDFLEIHGTGARHIPSDWIEHGAQAYLGTVVSGFPNMAFLLGPNSGLSHSSAWHVVESQMSYVVRWLDAVLRCDGALDVREDVQAYYNATIQARLVTTVWASGCRSWYLDRAGRNTAIYPGLTADFRRRLGRFAASDFRRLPRQAGT